MLPNESLLKHKRLRIENTLNADKESHHCFMYAPIILSPMIETVLTNRKSSLTILIYMIRLT
jgi:hypothetical protein